MVIPFDEQLDFFSKALTCIQVTALGGIDFTWYSFLAFTIEVRPFLFSGGV
jgi:hypothetical protein